MGKESKELGCSPLFFRIFSRDLNQKWMERPSDAVDAVWKVVAMSQYQLLRGFLDSQVLPNLDFQT